MEDEKEESLREHLTKIREASTKREFYESSITIRMSDENDDIKEVDNNYIQESEKNIKSLLKYDDTEEENMNEKEKFEKKLTKLIKRDKIYIFRYQIKEEDEEGNTTKIIIYSFEEDKMIVNTRDISGNKLDKPLIYEYKDYPQIFFSTVIANLSNDSTNSIFFRKNTFNSSIANTVLKYYFDNPNCLIGRYYNSFIEFVCVYFNRFNIKHSEAHILVFAEIGDIECYKYFLQTTNYDNGKSFRESLVESAIIGGNNNIIRDDDNDSIVDKTEDTYRFFVAACTNKNMYNEDETINDSLIRYYLANYGETLPNDDLIGLFGHIYDPRIAKIVFNELLNRGCDIYNIENNPSSYLDILSYVAISGSIEVMQYILCNVYKTFGEEKKGEINSIIGNKLDSNGKAILVNAVCYRNVDIIKFLLLIPEVNINILDRSNQTPFYWVIFNKDIEITKLLLTDDRINLNMSNMRHDDGILGWTIYTRDIEMFKLLLYSNKIDINLENKNGKTPLQLAIEFKRLNEIAKILIDYQQDLDINKKNENLDYSYLEYSIKCNNLDIAIYLLQKEANNINYNVKTVKEKEKKIHEQEQKIIEMKKLKPNCDLELLIGAFKSFLLVEPQKSKCNIF